MRNFISISVVLTFIFAVTFTASVGWELGFQYATSTGVAGAVG